MGLLDRRQFLTAAGIAGASTATARASAAIARPDWSALKARLGERLQPVRSPLVAARSSAAGVDALFANLKNPYFIGDDPALTQTLGWTDAWTSQPSSYVVAAQSAADVAAAVDFARTSGVRLVVKGGGHSYFGNSNAANSLLLWTKKLDRIEQHEAFVPTGAPPATRGEAAVSVGAGCLWGRVYHETMVKHGRYVQGGGCLTVGVAGFVQGGGFGSLSKAFGTGASNLLEAEVVTADGRVRIVNPWRDPELFFALSGGSGGTFGIVTRLTMRTHELPAEIGAALFEVTARDERSWRALVERTMAHYADHLFNPHWGEQIRFERRTMSVAMVSQGLDKAQIERAWKPLFDWIKAQGDDYALAGEPLLLAIPARQFWNPAFLKSLPGVVLSDNRPGASADNVFWAGNLSETGQVLHAYKSRWIPQRLLRDAGRKRLVDAILAGAAEWSVSLHMNKGLAGGDAAQVGRVRSTATNPAVLDAFALVIVAAEGPPAWPGIAGHEPDLATGRADAAGVARAFAPFERLVPGGGCYVSEADYFGRDWRSAYWGSNYGRLLRAKRRYDPANFFRGHHTVGT
ncbi:MAG: FAD-binding oxidoreductase [Sphingomicrobium sp.]